MSYKVSSLKTLPTEGIDHFIHVVDVSPDGTHTNWISRNLEVAGASFGPRAGLAVGNEFFAREVRDFLAKHVTDGFHAIDSLLSETTCLVISEGHLAKTTAPIYLLPIAPRGDSASEFEMITTLFFLINKAIVIGRLHEAVVSLGAVEFSLSEAGGGVVVCTLRELNKMLELKPNVAGVGFNVNAIVEKLLPPSVRQIPANG